MLYIADAEQAATLPCNQGGLLIWYSDDPAIQAEAKRRCRGCMRKLDCLEDTLETEAQMNMRLTGVHGGLTPAERNQLESVRRIA